MANVTVTTDIDNLLKSADNAAARTNLGIIDPTLESVTTNGATTLNDITVGKIATAHPTNPANTNIASGSSSASIGGTGNVAAGNRSGTFGGRINQANGVESSAFGGTNQIVRGNESEGFGGTNITLNTKFTNTVGGANHVVGLASSLATDSVAKHSLTLGGESSIIENATHSAIVGGQSNTIQTGHDRSVILGGTGITTDAADTAYVSKLNIKTEFKLPTGATDDYVLTSDATGVGTWQSKTKIQGVQTTSGVLSFDYTAGEIVKTILTESVTSIAITNAAEGDSGMIIFSTDGSATYSMTVGSPNIVISGDPIDFDSLTVGDVITMKYYYTGTALLLYISGDQDLSGLQVKPAEGAFVDGDKTALDSALQPADPTLDSVTTNGATTLNNISVGRIVTLHPTNPVNNNVATGNQACSIGGVVNVVSGNRSVNYGGRENQVTGNDSSAIGGFGQIVIGQESEGLGSTATTLNTKYTSAVGTINSVVGLAGAGTASTATAHSSVLGGNTNIIESATGAVIIGGTTNTIQTGHDRSVILGGTGTVTDAADTAFAPSLDVQGTVYIKQRAAADVNKAGKCQLWVENTTGDLYLTLPDGTSKQIAFVV